MTLDEAQKRTVETDPEHFDDRESVRADAPERRQESVGERPQAQT